jgi:U6 snRNA-associated Sm-like protein LSm8
VSDYQLANVSQVARICRLLHIVVRTSDTTHSSLLFMSSLQGYVDRTSFLSSVLPFPHLLPSKGRVLLVLQDGRAIIVRIIPILLSPSPHTRQGVLAGYDQKSNVVLSDSKERVYSMDEGVEEIPLGLYLVKGDMMCVVTKTPLNHYYTRHCPVYTRAHHVPIESLSAR